MGTAEFKVPGGKLIRVTIECVHDKIQNIKITGDFFLHPEETIQQIENSLVGRKCDSLTLKKTIDQVIQQEKATIVGATSADFVNVILDAAKS